MSIRERREGKSKADSLPLIMLNVLGPTSHLLTVEFDLPSHIDISDDQAVLDWFCGIYSGGTPQRVAIHEVFWAMLYPNEKPAEVPRCLAVVSCGVLSPFAIILTDRMMIARVPRR